MIEPRRGIQGSAEARARERVIAALAQRLGVDEAEAARRLRWQDAVPALTARAGEVLGERYGGVWIDAVSGRVALGVTRGMARAPLDEETLERALALLGDVGLAGGGEVVPVAHGWSELLAIHAAISRELAAEPEAARRIGAGIDTSTNSVTLRVPAIPPLGPAAQALLARWQARYGEAARLRGAGEPPGH